MAGPAASEASMVMNTVMNTGKKRPHRAPGPCHGLLRRYLADDRAAVAVEYGIVGLPFLVMLFAIIETTIVYFASTALENGLLEVSRRIRTGQIQADEISAEDFKNQLCAEVTPLIDCDANLYVDVRTFDDFDAVEFLPPIDENGNINMSFQFDPGNAGDVVLVRAFYVWDIVTPVIGAGLSNMAGSHRLLASSAAFRNEPFGDLLE